MTSGLFYPSLATIRQAATRSNPDTPTCPGAAAAVALVLVGVDTDLSLCVIRRARRVGDPWSGHMALPGGRFAPTDIHLRRTAERETFEEVALRLADAEYLGHMMDHTVSRADGTVALTLAAFAYHFDAPVALTTSSEVAQAFWVPLKALWTPGKQTLIDVRRAEGRRTHAATRVDRHHVWGMTRSILSHVGHRAGAPLPDPNPRGTPTHTITLDPQARDHLDRWARQVT